MIHACGMTDLPALVAASPDVVAAARAALAAGRPVFCDSMMVANGITRARLPAANPCTARSRTPASRSKRRPPAPPARPSPSTTGCPS